MTALKILIGTVTGLGLAIALLWMVARPRSRRSQEISQDALRSWFKRRT